MNNKFKIFRVWQPLAGFLVLIPVLLAVASCSTNTDHYKGIDASIESSSFATALVVMEDPKIRNKLYPPKNEILYHLDRGMIEHHAGLWEASSQSLQLGERLIEEAFTKSISQAVTSYIANDNTKEYSGEDYEDIYINVFNALNYYHRGSLESAMVEIRRVNEKLLHLANKYEVAVEKAKGASDLLAGNPDYAIEAKSFSNSALARYLGVLFYRANGNRDSARIDMEELRRAFALAPSIYTFPVPTSLDEELEIPMGEARLNVLSFTGLSPVKEEINIMLPLPFPAPNNRARLSLPQMIIRPSVITSTEVVVEAPGFSEKFKLELLEDMGKVAQETFTARYGLILLKSAARTIIKNAASAVAAKVANERGSGFGSLVGLAGSLASNLSENADIRIARYFPSYAYIGGISLEPGVYNVTINHYNNFGLVATESRENFHVREGRLNLTEFICLK